jgi:hypothetical protein
MLITIKVISVEFRGRQETIFGLEPMGGREPEISQFQHKITNHCLLKAVFLTKIIESESNVTVKRLCVHKMLLSGKSKWPLAVP